MAIKASATITLAGVIDVKATYRYYLLQSSTLAKPSKPTTFPPSASWDDTEPTYTEGSTNSLYFVDCTVFSDDTFQYSEVSLSSAYEAAKLAYNKAQQVEESTNTELGEVQQIITNQHSDIIEYVDGIKLEAEQTYVKQTAYEEYKEETEASLLVQFDNITAQISTTETTLSEVDGELQTYLTKFYKYFTFDENGITIGSGSEDGANVVTLQLDNENGIVFSKNGIPFGRWNGVDFFTGNIIVEVNERAQFGNFAFIPRSNGNLSFKKVR